ncbi:hypothetical protein ACVWYF_004007 [Hymenobacter sp. UYAg731]
MIPPTIMFSVMLLAVLALFSSYSHASRVRVQPIGR